MDEKYNDEKVKKILESEQIPERLEPENIKKFLDDTNASGRKKKIRHGIIMRTVSLAAALAVAVGVSAYFTDPSLFNRSGMLRRDDNNGNIVMAVESMEPAVRYSDIYSYFLAASNVNKFKDFISGFFGNGTKKYDGVQYIAEDAAEGAAYDNGALDDTDEENMDMINGGNADSAAESSAEKEHSDTYNQEEGVLEADIVKTDGSRIFYAYDDTVCMAAVDKGRFTASYRTVIPELLGTEADKRGGYINDMYIYNNKLILIYSNGYGGAYDGCYAYPAGGDTYAMILSIGDKLTLDGYFIQDGGYNDVRLMSDGYMYLVTNDRKYLDFNRTKAGDIEDYIPRYCINGEYECVPAEDVLIPREKCKDIYDYVSYVNFSGINLNSAEPWQPVDMKTVAGYSNTIYCSQENLYVASGYDETEITRFSLEKGVITPAVSGKVKGRIKDQFSMSEYNGYFRIATTENIWEERIAEEDDSAVASNTLITRNNNVYVLGMDMKVLGSISDFGINEEIKSVNFNGNTAYVVTFRNTDPLYAFDLSDPENPKMLDELKISGYSTYMQNWSDGMLVGFGAEADENTGFEEGIKLTMFDNSNPNELKALDSVSIVGNDEENVYSEGTHERKALYIDPERNIIAFPVEKYFYSVEPDKDVVEHSYMFYSYEGGKLVYKGKIGKSIVYDYQSWDKQLLTEGFRRVVYVDGYFCAVSVDMFKSADAVNFNECDTLNFEIKYDDSKYEYMIID